MKKITTTTTTTTIHIWQEFSVVTNQRAPTKKQDFLLGYVYKMSNHEDTLLFRRRHTLAHVLAEAVQRVQQWDVEVAI